MVVISASQLVREVMSVCIIYSFSLYYFFFYFSLFVVVVVWRKIKSVLQLEICGTF